MKKLILLTILSICAALPASADLLLSEVYYDYPGGDDGYEWVEIVNTSLSPVDLSGYILAWGGTDYSYGQIILDGTIEACSIFVVGGPDGDADNGMPNYSLTVNLTPDIQNSGTTADGVALFAPGADTLIDTPLDAVIYGDANNNGLVDETGLVGAVDVPDAPSGSSIHRVSLVGAWAISDTPDPFDHDFAYECDGVVPVEAISLDALKSVYR